MKSTIFSTLLPTPPVTISSKLLIIVLSTILHTVLFYIVPYTPFLSHDDKQLKRSTVKQDVAKYNKRVIVIRNYAMSTIHSITALAYVLAFYYSYLVDLHSIPRTFDNGVSGTGDEYIPYMINWSIGYFIYDLVIMLYYKKQLYNLGSLIHHVLMILAFGGGTFMGTMSPFHFYLLLEEFSTPALNLKTLYKHNSTIADTSSLVFAVSFFLCRICYGTYIFLCGIPNFIPYITLANKQGRYIDLLHVTVQLFLFLSTRILNFYWMALIGKKVYTALFSKRQRKKSFAQSVAVDEKSVDKSIRKDFQTYVGPIIPNGVTAKSRSRKDD